MIVACQVWFSFARNENVFFVTSQILDKTKNNELLENRYTIVVHIHTKVALYCLVWSCLNQTDASCGAVSFSLAVTIRSFITSKLFAGDSLWRARCGGGRERESRTSKQKHLWKCRSSFWFHPAPKGEMKEPGTRQDRNQNPPTTLDSTQWNVQRCFVSLNWRCK